VRGRIYNGKEMKIKMSKILTVFMVVFSFVLFQSQLDIAGAQTTSDTGTGTGSTGSTASAGTGTGTT